MKKTIRLFALAALGLFVSFAMNAQITNSAMSGKITDAAGAVPGAAVIAVHTPSGSQYYAVTNAEGLYSIQGMRPGGPYEVTVQMLGYKTTIYKDITLQLGEVFNQNVALTEASEQLDEVVVVASVSKFTTEKTGASTNISQSQISEMPSINRSISDLARLSPYASGMSFAGGDGRMTNFTLDGANLNNNFGLSSSLPGGGSPVSVDAIQEIQVVVSPFDVRQTNFIGGGVNAITKSGTNTFKGTVYGYYKNQSLRGNKVAGEDLGDRAKESRTVWGVTLGGPIVKNKLFFFVNYEQEKNPGQVIKYRANKGGEKAEGNVSRTLASDMKAVQDYMMNTYNYDTGSYENFPGDGSNRRILARLDWNIATGHKLALRYNYTKNVAWNAPNGNSSDTGYRLNNTYRVGNESMAFANNMYSMDNKVQTWSLDYTAKFSDNVSNQFLATYSSIDDVRGSTSTPFPHVDIIKQDDSGNWKPYMSLGYELFTWNNGVHNKIVTVKDEVTVLAGAHKIMAGINYEHEFANNAYMRNGALYYRYAWTDESSIIDVLNGTPESFAITYGWNGNLNPNAQVTFNQIGAYVQDEWNVSDKFKLNYGVRFDTIIFDNSDIATNKAYLEYRFRDDIRIDTGKWPNTRVQVSPRVGFVWDVYGDKSFKVRGGSGIFQGRLPLVYFTNMPTNASMVQNSVQYKSTWTNGQLVSKNVAKLDQFKGGNMITDAATAIDKLGLQKTLDDSSHTAGSTLSGVDPNFKMPMTWKSAIAVDYQIPTSFPFTVTAEGMFNKVIYGVMVDNININNYWLTDEASAQRFAGIDNRLMYPSSKGRIVSGKDAPYLVNTTKGYGWTANVTVNMTPVENLNIMAAYTHTESKEVSGLPGSDPLSTWQGMITVDGPNFGVAQRSQYVVPDKVMASVNYLIPWMKDNRGLHINLFYQGYSDGGYSWCYSNDMNGDGVNNDLMYIYAKGSEIKWKSNAAEQAAAYDKFVAQDKYLSSHKGQYAEAYAARSPWLHALDLRLAEDIAFRIGNTKHNFQVSVDIDNVLNLFNSNWGLYKNAAASNNTRILKYEGVDASNTPMFSMNKVNDSLPTETWSVVKSSSQCWQIQFGLKYFFN
ncbi:MAG: TonB-dependent receptor [Bacteroidales bacterium]|nr:TonB-dependent receptor [Candidatus Cacconaster caballi]